MRKVLAVFAVGFALAIFHSFRPDGMIPMDLDILIGGLFMIGSGGYFLYWWIDGVRNSPSVIRLEITADDLGDTTPEILFLLEDGWGVKKIVDMVSANYQLPPKLVYEHVVEVMGNRQKVLEESASQGADPIRTGGKGKPEFNDGRPVNMIEFNLDEEE